MAEAGGSGVVCSSGASEDLLDEIYEVELKCFKDPYPRGLLLYYMRLSGDLFVTCRVGSQLAGYAIGILEDRGKKGHVVSICVDPDHRRRGVGRDLMLLLKDLFRSKGAREIVLEVRVGNEPAIRLYRRLGFEIVDLLRRYYSDGEDAYLMRKRLVESDQDRHGGKDIV